MKTLVALATLVSVGCALGSRSMPPQPTPVWVRSHNRSPVDVYLLCGSSNARWLGSVWEKGSEAFEIPIEQPYCVQGLNFFLVVRNFDRGYWVGPLRPGEDDAINLVIERYAGLSNARVRNAR